MQVLKSDKPGRRPNSKPIVNPPMAVPAIPPKPDDLPHWGSWLWDLVTPELQRMGILGQLDITELEAYCRSYDEWKREDPQSRRWLWLMDRTSKLAQQVGCSPAARLRMNLPEPKAEEEGAVFAVG
jgi:phage terminase small subunit